jgi:S-adenosylmethionine synthetase
VETFGTTTVSQKKLKDFMDSLLDTSVTGIIEGLDLRKPIYYPTASYGHFGREQFPWEKVKRKELHPSRSGKDAARFG